MVGIMSEENSEKKPENGTTLGELLFELYKDSKKAERKDAAIFGFCAIIVHLIYLFAISPFIFYAVWNFMAIYLLILAPIPLYWPAFWLGFIIWFFIPKKITYKKTVTKSNIL